MFRRNASCCLAVLFVLLHFALGCGDDVATSPSQPNDDLAGAPGDGGTGGERGAEMAGVAGTCAAQTCQALGVDCGQVDDGCGRLLHCGGACSEAGAGGVAGDEHGAGGATTNGGGVCDPDALLATPVANARRARSAGYQGSDPSYLQLFDVVCQAPSDCLSACSTAGGQPVLCQASECLPDGQTGNSCVPAPVWDNLNSIRAEDTLLTNMCQLILVNTTYRDVLLTDQFKLQVPAGAAIRGITVQVRRAGDDSVADDSVRLIKNGEIGGADRALPDSWSFDIGWVTYGGPDDLWGLTWTADDLNGDQFGVALSAAYAKNVGNTVAYVDQVRVTVSYNPRCE